MTEKSGYSWRTPVIAIDFDGCLCRNEFPDIGDPNWEVINEAKRLQESGACLILWTCRDGTDLDRAVEACREWGLKFDAVNGNPEFKITLFGDNDCCRKVSADEYWDDRAVYMGTPGAYRSIRGSTVQTAPNIDNRKFIDEALRPEIAHLNSLRMTSNYYDGLSILLQECLERMELLMDTLEERGEVI